MAVLEVKNIEKHFDSTKVLRDVSFEMEEGSALAIIGSSGSGKTTLKKNYTNLGAGTLKKINKIDKPLAILTRGHRDSI